MPTQSGLVVLELSGCILSRSKTLRHKAVCWGVSCSSAPIVTRKLRCW